MMGRKRQGGKGHTFLIRITEHLVLLIRHGSPDLGRHELFLILFAAVATSLVAPNIVQEESKGSHGTPSLSAHDCQLGGSEVGRIAGLEGLGSNNVAQGERAAHNGSSKGALGGTADVGDSPLHPLC